MESSGGSSECEAGTAGEEAMFRSEEETVPWDSLPTSYASCFARLRQQLGNSAKRRCPTTEPYLGKHEPTDLEHGVRESDQKANRGRYRLFDEHGDQLFAMTDAIAGRGRMIGGTTLRSIGDLYLSAMSHATSD
jgi:hypothetical protein